MMTDARLSTGSRRIGRMALPMLAVVMAGLVPGVFADVEPSEQDRTIAAIEQAGGKVVRDVQRPGKPVVRVDLMGLRAGELLKRTATFPELRMLGVRFNRLTDADLEPLHGLTNLESLNLAYNKITDEGLKHMEGLTELRTLIINDNRITDAGLTHLSALAGLLKLSLAGTEVTDVGLERLKGLKGLRTLSLNLTQVTDAGVEDLRRSLPLLVNVTR